MYENIATASINTEINGIELSFGKKPPYEVLKDLKDKGFRWHNKKQVWYAKNTVANVKAVEKYVDLDASDPGFGITPTGTVDVRALRQAQEPSETTSVVESKGETKENEMQSSGCVADFYDSVGSAVISRDSTSNNSMFIGSQGYYEDINAYVWCNYHSAVVIDLENAMKRGKVCEKYTIYANDMDIGSYLLNECNIHSAKDLYDFVKSGKSLPEPGTLYVRQEKGVEVFSPFVSVKPLKQLPEKWKKADLVKAIMSGQIYSGVLDQRLTDDYAYDAAYNFGSGTSLNLPKQAEDLVEGCRDCYIRTDNVDENGIASIHFSYANDMKTFLFDVNCDLAESIVRREQAQQELQAHNEAIKNSVKQFAEKDINPDKVYLVDKVVEDINTGKLGIDTEIVQGFVLVDRLGYEEITNLQEAEFVTDKLYGVADFFNRRSTASEDSRIINTGNWGQVCSGKAIEELTREGVSLNLNASDYKNPKTFDAVKKSCEDFISGRTGYMLGERVDYSKSLEKLIAEEKRLSQVPSHSEPKQERKSSLADLIGFAEAKRQFESSRSSRDKSIVNDNRVVKEQDVL